MSKIVFTNGAFDILHYGHLSLLKFCRDLVGDDGKLVVAIDSDSKIKKDKFEYKPIYSCDERLNILMNEQKIVLIDEIFVFDSNQQLYNIIKNVSPDIIVKGSDWKNNVIGSDIARVEYYDVIKSISTSKIIDKVIEKVTMPTRVHGYDSQKLYRLKSDYATTN